MDDIVSEEPRFDEEELKEIARLQSDPTSEHYYNDPDETFMSKVRRKLEPYGDEFKGFIEYLFSPSKHFGTGQYNEGGMADQMTMFGYTAKGAQQESDKFVREAGNIDEDTTKAASFLIPFFDSGVNISNVVEEYMKPEGERDYDYIKSQFTEAGQNAALEAGLILMGGVVGKYGAKGVKALANKVKQYEIDPSAMSAFGVGAIKKKAPIIKEGTPTIEAAGLTDEAIDAWREANATSPEFRKALKGRNEELMDLAAGVKEGRVFNTTYWKRADELRPIRKVKDVPKPSTVKEIVSALDSGKRKSPIVGLNYGIPDGEVITARLDIPAYVDYDTWIPTLRHAGKTMYKAALRMKNVKFIQPEGKQVGSALDVAVGPQRLEETFGLAKKKAQAKGNKSPFAVMEGSYVDGTDDELFTMAKEVFDSDEWTQVGYDPVKRGFFYDRETGQAILEADEVIQVGHLVLARNAKKTDPDVFPFNEGGQVMNMQKQMSLFEYGGIADDGMKKDPVSGNDIPPGSLAKEVRDDIPAMLSEGEYVVPADVLRYYGVNFFENLRGQAKQGLQAMEQNGRIGGEPMSPDQVQQNMSGQPMAGAPAVQPIAANTGPLITDYAQQAQQLGSGQQFDPSKWSTVGGSTFTQQPQDNIVTFKTFVNAQSGERKIIKYVNGKLKNPADEQYTTPPYYELGSAALKKAQQATQQPTSSGADSGGEGEPSTPGTGKTSISAFSGENVNITDPLAAAKAMVENVPNLGGKLGMMGAAMLGPMGMTALGLGQTAVSLDSISDLNAMAILAEAQGKTKEAETIAKMVEEITGKSNMATQALADIAATGTQKAQGVLDRLGIDLSVKDISKWTTEQKAEVAKMAEHVQKVAEDNDKDPAEVMVVNQDLSNMEDAQRHADENPTGITTGDPDFQSDLESAIEDDDFGDLMAPALNKGGLMARKKANKK